jgi:hypothetical protein
MAQSPASRTARTRGNRRSTVAGDGIRPRHHRRGDGQSLRSGPIDQRKHAALIVAIVVPSSLFITAIAAVILALSGCAAEPIG